MKLPNIVLIGVLSINLPTTSAARLQARQEAPRPFSLTTRNQDVSNGTAVYLDLGLAQATDKSGNPLPQAHLTWDANPTVFRLHHGVLSTNFTYINGAGETVEEKWKNIPPRGNRRLTFKPISRLEHPARHGQMNIEVGGHIALSPGGKFSSSDWTLCDRKDGSGFGLAIYDVYSPGISCEPVYTWISANNGG